MKSSTEEKSRCVANGGDPELQSRMCSPNVARETVEAWLRGGDVDAGSSAYNYKFMPIWNFLTNVDFEEFEEAANTLEKAVEYSNCRIGQNPPVQDWSDSGCRCVRRCENGGTLDEASCTCKCRGDVRQGFTGPTCSETYGSCQPGIGTWSPKASNRCRASGKCASTWGDSQRCGKTEVCCAASWGAKCCPFGSTCECNWNNCQCIAPEPQQVSESRRRRRGSSPESRRRRRANLLQLGSGAPPQAAMERQPSPIPESLLEENDAKCNAVAAGGVRRKSAWRQFEHKCKCKKKDHVLMCEDDACPQIGRYFPEEGLGRRCWCVKNSCW